jgi:Caspase domain
VFDRGDFAGAAGAHALIIGISAYPNLTPSGGPTTPEAFGMHSLSSTALAAYRVYEWLSASTTRLAVPLSTIRLLLLPSAEEIAAEPRLAAFNTPWSLDEVLQAATGWRADARRHEKGLTLFYFAGHGVQRTQDDTVLLMPAFGSGIGGTLRHAIDTATLCAGMAPTPSKPRIAQTQIYFIDACRVRPADFKNYAMMPTTAVFDVEPGRRDQRCMPIYFASLPGDVANGVRGRQTVFSEALIECLRGAAGEALEEMPNGHVPYHVGVHSLDRAIGRRIEEGRLGGQTYELGGRPKDATICLLDGPPPVEFELVLDPGDAAGVGAMTVSDWQEGTVHADGPPIVPHPWTRTLPMGNYIFEVRFDRPGRFLYYRRPRQLTRSPTRLVARAPCCRRSGCGSNACWSRIGRFRSIAGRSTTRVIC